MDNGAVETWLARTFMYAKDVYPGVQWTFYCTLAEAGRWADQVRLHGAEVVISPVPFGQTRKFLGALRAFLKSNNFDVLHSHHDFLSGFYLWAAAGLPIKKRLVHLHNTDEALPTPSRWKHRLLLPPLRQTCLRMADGVIGISNHVLDQFLRHRPRRTGRDVVCYYGVDVNPIRKANRDPQAFRQEMNLPVDAKILLFVGRMSPLKNPTFVVDVLHATLQSHASTYALFAGEGDLTKAVIQRARELGVENNIRMLGWRSDTAHLMRNSDVFVFPRPESPKEGLGLVVVESQACGLPMLTTFGICDDAILDPQLVTRIATTESADQWATKVIESLPRERGCCVEMVAQSRFGMHSATQAIMAQYGIVPAPSAQVR